MDKSNGEGDWSIANYFLFLLFILCSNIAFYGTYLTTNNLGFIASAMGVKEFVPPYVGYDLQPEDILTGVTFASGATGYDPLTSTILNVISMPDQLKMFEEYKERMKAIAGEERTASILSNSLYVVCAGTDDIANTYFTTPFRRPHYDIPSYVNLLISGATTFLEVNSIQRHVGECL